MCRWLTYCGDPIYLDKVLFEPRNSLISQSLRARHSHVTTNGDGFGIGWYGERPTPGVYRDILPAWNDQNLKSLAHQIRSGLFLAHVRASTGTATSRANCHPFAHGKWLFMHNGQIGGYERIRRRLEGMIPHGYRCIGAYQGNRMVGVAGYWLGVKFWCGEFLEPDNVFVLPELRSAGIGAKIMDYLEDKARQLGCKMVALDSYVTYHGAHKFYIRRDYEIVGYHFVKKTEES